MSVPGMSREADQRRDCEIVPTTMRIDGLYMIIKRPICNVWRISKTMWLLGVEYLGIRFADDWTSFGRKLGMTNAADAQAA
jgi:hypothetical protein